MGYATKKIVIEVADMDAGMMLFWQTLYENVLSEYKYLNKLSGADFLRVTNSPCPSPPSSVKINGVQYFYELLGKSRPPTQISLTTWEIPISCQACDANVNQDVLCPLGGAY
jgi:hypothetical protein